MNVSLSNHQNSVFFFLAVLDTLPPNSLESMTINVLPSNLSVLLQKLLHLVYTLNVSVFLLNVSSILMSQRSLVSAWILKLCHLNVTRALQVQHTSKHISMVSVNPDSNSGLIDSFFLLIWYLLGFHTHPLPSCSIICSSSLKRKTAFLLVILHLVHCPMFFKQECASE